MMDDVVEPKQIGYAECYEAFQRRVESEIIRSLGVPASIISEKRTGSFYSARRSPLRLTNLRASEDDTSPTNY